MKVSCGECSASFVAPDDKIRGRLVKYRCRKCGATIVADGTKLEPEVVELEQEADVGDLTSLPPPPRPSGESVTHVRAAPRVTAKIEVPADPPTIPVAPGLLVPPEPPSVPLPLLDEKPAAPRVTPKRPGGDTSAAFKLGPTEQGASARRKPKSLPPPPPTDDPIVLPQVDEPIPVSSGMLDLQVLSADIESVPSSTPSGRVDFASLVDAPPPAAKAGDFDWGGSLDAPAPAPLWETPAADLPAPAAKIEPLLSVSPVAAKPAPAPAPGEDKRLPGWVWAVGALAAAGVVYFLFGRGEAREPAAPARAAEVTRTAEPTKPEPTKPADAVPTAPVDEPKAEPKKDEPVAKDEPKRAEPVAKDEPKRAEPVARDEPKSADPIAREEPKKEELKKEEPKKEEPKKEEPKKEEPKPEAAFNKDAARAALGGAAASAAGCAQPDGPRGTGTVRVTFSSSGRATQALIQGPPFAGTSTGSCIASKFRGISVPAFTGDAVSVTKSVTIQ